jgi:inositol phosphorylceramide mannosyltransferase catalytic subunit
LTAPVEYPSASRTPGGLPPTGARLRRTDPQSVGAIVDTDVECRRPLIELLEGSDAFAALEAPGRIGTAVLGAVAGHSVFERAARLARRTLGIYEPMTASANGAYFLSLIVEQEQNMTIFDAPVFYPFLWDELERRHEAFPDAYAVHYWAGSWREGSGG